MSKRIGYLIQTIADPDNLRLAFWKARKGKDNKTEVIEFRKNLDTNLLSLRNELLNGTVALGNYHYFTIHDPKERLICAASFPERVLHHAIMNICHTYFEKFQVFDSYATRVDKGQYAALERAKYYSSNYRWYCKLDVRKYFDSIDHEVLYNKLTIKFKDPYLLNLFLKIIKSYQTAPNKGLPIGNLTSQYFANFYLGFADHFIKEKLQATAYVRYMDDMVFWSNDKVALLSLANQFTAFVNTNLKLTLKPYCINNMEKGLPFLGYVVFNNNVRLNKNSKKRFIQKMKLYHSNLENEKWTQAQYAKHVLPLIAFTQHANSINLRRKLLCKMEAG
jgi:RNA-directed DNA polymerase